MASFVCSGSCGDCHHISAHSMVSHWNCTMVSVLGYYNVHNNVMCYVTKGTMCITRSIYIFKKIVVVCESPFQVSSSELMYFLFSVMFVGLVLVRSISSCSWSHHLRRRRERMLHCRAILTWETSLDSID